MTNNTIQDIGATAPASRRILTFDIIRGFMLLVIMVGHFELPPNFYDFFTGRGRLYVSAAEGFFFLSGLLVGIVYKRKLAKGMRFVFKKLWTRAAELYVGSVILTLSYSFIVAKTNHFYIKEGLPNPVDWNRIIPHTLTLRFDYGWADFLGRFAILTLLAPLVFYLINKGWWKLVIILSLAGYLLRRDNFTLGWQLIFNSGMLVGYYWHELNQRWSDLGRKAKTLTKRSLVTVTTITFGFSYASVYVLSELNEYFNSLSPGWQHFTWEWSNFLNQSFIYADKFTMGPVRVVLFFIWAATGYMLVKRYESRINSRAKSLLLLIGQNSLFVYIFHSMIVFGLKFIIPAHTNAIQNFGFVSLGLGILISGTFVYKYFRTNWPHINRANLLSHLVRRSRQFLSY